MPRHSPILITSIILVLMFSGCKNNTTIDESSTGNLSNELVTAVQEESFARAESQLTFGIRTDLYELYRKKYKNVAGGTSEIELSLKNFRTNEPGYAHYTESIEGTGIPGIITGENGAVSWTFSLSYDTLYQLYVEYYPVAGKNSAIERRIEINSEVPFFEASHFILTRVWRDKSDPKKDNRGNEIRALLVEKPRINSAYFSDYLGYSDEPYDFYFPKGNNTLTIRSIKEPVAFTRILLTRKPEIKSYDDVKKTYDLYGNLPVEPIMVQAEKTYEKSDPMIYPLSDRSSPATIPQHHSKIRLNTIGGDHWKLPDQWISWEIDILSDGLYKISVRARQNLVQGLRVNRQLLIDGKAPFRETEKIGFEYSTGWKMTTIGTKEKPYLFYLDKGKHILTMEITLGDLGPILRDASNSIYTLNYAYRKILMLTGPEPDIYRDYNIDIELPYVMKILAEQSRVLSDLADRIKAYADDRSHAATLNRLSHMLARMYATPFIIPRSMKELKTNVGSLATWVYTSREQPLEIDYLLLQGKDEKVPNHESNIIENTFYGIASFVSSFFENYDNVGNTYSGEEEDIITAWVLTGRDQAQILKRMIDDDFTPKTGIPVNLKLVSPDVLLPAAVAGIGPDVAMQVGSSDPVNYAIRHAVADLTQFPDFDDIASGFHPSAIVPFRYNGGVYGLPETQEFLVMFYRKDILDELNISCPDTWDDLYKIMPDLQKNYMDFLVPVRTTSGNVQIYGGSNTYNMLLFQNNGEVYRDNGIAVGIDSEIGIEVFKQWTDLFVNYKLPEYYDFRSRFRTGESPLGIASYTEYNTLTVFAPEIRGLWGFMPVPATILADGSLNRTVPGSGLATVMLEKKNGNKENVWKFMKWWLSTEIQELYGKELECVMGSAARYPTAGLEVVGRLAWPAEDFKNLMTQWKSVRGVPEVPGSYYLPRHLDNAFRSVLYEGRNPRNTLLDYSKLINDEITSKRKEFGLETLEDRETERTKGDNRD